MLTATLCLLLAAPPGERDAQARGLLACLDFAPPVCGVVSQPNAQQMRWERRDLTWSIEAPYPPGWTEAQVRTEVEAAFKVWSAACALTFREVPPSAAADIRISFALGSHARPPYTDAGDPPFLGPAGVLAHAFFPGPEIGGDAHFDLAEPWVRVGGQGYALRSTLTHELGHSLGLDHTEDPTSIMFASYTGSLKLNARDARQVATRYGPPSAPDPSGFSLDREGITAAGAREAWEAPGPGTFRVELSGSGLTWRLERDGRAAGPWQSRARSITCDEAGAWAIAIRGSGPYRLTITRQAEH